MRNNQVEELPQKQKHLKNKRSPTNQKRHLINYLHTEWLFALGVIVSWHLFCYKLGPWDSLELLEQCYFLRFPFAKHYIARYPAIMLAESDPMCEGIQVGTQEAQQMRKGYT